ncbi:hypothetical protein [Lactobacillus delbrueckii]|uniref:hypothetical protein n=1 Tax=Lactobacillus delbrueckii TaxID=1584 RepID=UPI00177E0339|nr:hypothetical protein [Lactobacillus delbrueckii]MBD5836029.1 hypothetical protein [Lactobacillus delbrueckii]
MQYQKSKFFWKQENGHKLIISEPYDDNCEYYSYLKEKRNVGMSQVIITSRLMIELIKTIYTQYKGSVSKIEFAEEDDELDEQTNRILESLRNERAYLTNLLELLQALNEKTSIDISRIYFRLEYQDQDIAAYLQANGIVGINAIDGKELLTKMCRFLESKIFYD